MCAARIDRPRNSVPRIVDMIAKVFRALRHSGFLKAGTPFEMASTPVTAVPPDEKACSNLNSRAPE